MTIDFGAPRVRRHAKVTESTRPRDFLRLSTTRKGAELPIFKYLQLLFEFVFQLRFHVSIPAFKTALQPS